MSLVSIILPSFNKDAFVGQAIQSVVDQTYADWELLIVDDHSTDGSLAVIEAWKQKDARIHSRINDSGVKGGSACRNIGLEMARGQFAMFFDADDLLAPYCLFQRLEMLKKQPELDFGVFPMATLFEHIGDSASMWNSFEGDHLKRFLAHDLPWQTMMPMWRVAALNTLGGFDSSFQRLQDVELHTRALLEPSLKYKVFASAEADCYYRIEEDRIETGYLNYMQRKVSGGITYLTTFSDYLEKRDRAELCKYLKGTFFEILSQIYVAFQQNRLTKSDVDQLVEQLFSTEPLLKQLRGMDRLTLSVFMRLRSNKVQVPGIGFLTKRFLLL